MINYLAGRCKVLNPTSLRMQIANTAKNSSPWNPSNLSLCVAHFLFPTGCTTSVTQVSRRMDTEMDFVVFPHFSFDPISAKFARRMLVWKKAAVNYFPGNLSRLLSVTTSTDGSCSKTDGERGWGELGSAARLLLAATRTCHCLLRSHSLSPPYSPRPAWQDPRR